MVRNHEGLVNIDSLNVSSLKKSGAAQLRSQPHLKVAFDKVHLKGDTVTYSDYRFTPPKVTEFQANIDQRYANVDDLYALGEGIAKKAFTGSPLAGIDLGWLQNGVVSMMSNGTDSIKSATMQTMNMLGGLNPQSGGVASGARGMFGNILQTAPLKHEDK